MINIPNRLTMLVKQESVGSPNIPATDRLSGLQLLTLPRPSKTGGGCTLSQAASRAEVSTGRAMGVCFILIYIRIMCFQNLSYICIGKATGQFAQYIQHIYLVYRLCSFTPLITSTQSQGQRENWEVFVCSYLPMFSIQAMMVITCMA